MEPDYHRRSVLTESFLHEIDADARAVAEDRTRVAAAERALFHVGELAQSLRGYADDAELDRLLLAAARLWGDRHAADLRACLDALAAKPLPASLVLVVPRGHLRPASSPDAVAASARDAAPAAVIGIGAYGNALGAVAAWAAGAAFATVATRDAAPTDAFVVDESDAAEAARPPLATPVPPDSVAVDLSRGAWRRLVFDDKNDWPPIAADRERSKWRLLENGRRRFAKFVGRGRLGERKFERARRLARAGFIATPRELRGGYLVSDWVEAENVSVLPTGVDREDLVETVAAYLAFLAREFPVKDPLAGADVASLHARLHAEVTRLLGPAAAAELAPWGDLLPAIAARCRRVAVDGRLHRWEWLKLPSGGWLKTDAVEHAFDGVGAQDIAWDIAGATVELCLGDDERERLLQRLAREAGYVADATTLAFHELAYLAFHAGQAEENRWEKETRRYTDRLRRLLVPRWQRSTHEVTEPHGRDAASFDHL